MPLSKKSPTPTGFRILIADHQALVRSAIRVLLETKGGFAIIAEAADGPDTLVQIARTRPEVVLLDVAMPKLDGLEVTKRIRDGFPGIRVLALTALEGEQYVRAALAAGASGYVPKSATASELMEAIRVVVRGERYVHPRVAAACELDGRRSKTLPPLTDREIEVIRLIALGYSHKEAASELKLGVKTIETHKRRVMQKLGLGSRVDLVRVAAENGWVILAPSSDRIAAAALVGATFTR